MPYVAPTLADAQVALASRLNDPNFTHWVPEEITGYICEAMQFWNSSVQFWRDQASFGTTMGQSFYDLTTVLPTLRAQTVTNWDLVADIQYALLEPAAAGGTWTGSAQFTLAQVTSAIQRRRDQFLRDTGCILTHAVTTYGAPPATGRIGLSASVLIVRRAAWMPTATQLLQPMLRTDEWAANAFSPAWPQSTDPPSTYSTSATPPITLQLIPPTSLSGDLDLVSVNSGAALDATVESLLGIPDDLAWVIKFGALADLLGQDALALDPSRQAYCESRYQQGVQIAKKQAVVLAGRIDGDVATINALADADSYSPLWQLVPGEPEQLVIAGQNLIATWPRAGGGSPFTILLDVVRNAPVPDQPEDVLEFGQDVYDSILDYSQHLALFKNGPTDLELSMSLYQRAAAAAGITVNVQQASQPSRRPLLRQTQQDRQAVPEELQAVTVE